jgi:hypothetical protein
MVGANFPVLFCLYGLHKLSVMGKENGLVMAARISSYAVFSFPSFIRTYRWLHVRLKLTKRPRPELTNVQTIDRLLPGPIYSHVKVLQRAGALSSRTLEARSQPPTQAQELAPHKCRVFDPLIAQRCMPSIRPRLVSGEQRQMIHERALRRTQSLTRVDKAARSSVA